MKNYHLVHYTANEYSENIKNFQSAAYNVGMEYSLYNLVFNENISPEITADALRKALELCQLAGIEDKYHFRKIYIYDAALKTLLPDWRMSRNGFNLVVMQLPLPNPDRARWLWRLSSL